MDFHRRRRVDASIDMTPMIDTLLQLFLVFLLTASFMASAIPLNLPKASADQATPTEAVTVSLDAGGQLFVNQERISQTELRGRLLSFFQKTNQPSVIFRADKSLPYEKVLEPLVSIQNAGVHRVQLAFEGGAKRP